MKSVLVLVLFVSSTVTSAIPQTNAPARPVFTVIREATQIGNQQISVKGHLWIGKEGSMVYDSGYKSILAVGPSQAFSAKNGNWFTYFSRRRTRRVSELSTLTGHLQSRANGKLLLLVDDIAPEGAK